MEIPYGEIPHLSESTVVGHAGKLVVGEIDNVRVAILAGRAHGFEGHHPYRVVRLPRALRTFGVKTWVLTNAAGSMKKRIKPGDFVLICDHLNLTGTSPCVGLELFGGERFSDMSEPYSKRLRKLAQKISQPEKLTEGIYTGVLGPSFETAAEIQMFKKMGGSIVGMSTIWEVLALKQMGAEVIGISCVTNYCTGILKGQKLTHDETLETTRYAAEKFQKLLTDLVGLISTELPKEIAIGKA